MSRILVALIGAAAAASGSLWASLADGATASLVVIALRAIIAAQVGVFALLALQSGLRRVVRMRMPALAAQYERRDAWTYSPFAIAALSAVGLQVIWPVVIALLGLFAAAQAILLLSAARRAGGTASDTTRVAGLFFLSGMAALVYQVVWQRLLFSVVGVSMEAVTLIVSVFMLGLGLGALLGGRLSVWLPSRLTLVFALLELGIAAFGVASIPLIHFMGNATIDASMSVVALSLMGLLFPPTLLMGATLPVLVAHAHRRLGDVGGTLGLLYFVNTLGSAVACFATVGVLFAFLGLRGATYVAVALNVVVALAVYRLLARRERPA